MDTTTTPDTIPLACDLGAIEETERRPHLALAERLLFELPQERQELADGYAFRFTADVYPLLADYISRERLCCPFFSFELEVTPQQGPVWLRLRGGEGVKEFLNSQLEVALR
ncbi:MAG: hypothetical protein L0332_30095 [Chloroflexi bacterium]|nr:hypothetical protein [Chloroflexota bacterium]MCI0576961.1 hypothetical protein [Chloroflexota bacterium]MCI0645559.1 hypothetical protein [Chloroflexota bacterium]MCI0730954.1 hypothetical protein [Chloroflexota bacterium]